MTYGGAWSKVKRTPDTGGAARYTSGAGRSATLTTNASDIGLIVTRSAGSGHARISIDGVLVATVSIRRSATAYRQLIYSRHFPTVGPHTFRGGGRSVTGASSSTPSRSCAERSKVAVRSQTDRTTLLLYCARLVRSPMIEPGRGWAYVVLFSEIGISLLVTTLVGVLVGHWVDGQLGTPSRSSCSSGSSSAPEPGPMMIIRLVSRFLKTID